MNPSRYGSMARSLRRVSQALSQEVRLQVCGLWRVTCENTKCGFNRAKLYSLALRFHSILSNRAITSRFFADRRLELPPLLDEPDRRCMAEARVGRHGFKSLPNSGAR